MSEDMKQAIIIREDLKLSPGKAAVQACHASLSAYLELRKKKPSLAEEWTIEGQKKIVLKAPDIELLQSLYSKAKAEGIPSALIKDAGYTELPPGTVTALGIGPDEEERIDKIAGSLPLY